MTAGYGWWYGKFTTTPPSSQPAMGFNICDERLTFRRLPRPRRPSPRRFLPEARGRACRSSRPEISNSTSRNKISSVLRRRRCIEGCWNWDQMYHRWGGSPESMPYRNQPSQHQRHLLISRAVLITHRLSVHHTHRCNCRATGRVHAVGQLRGPSLPAVCASLCRAGMTEVLLCPASNILCRGRF